MKAGIYRDLQSLKDNGNSIAMQIKIEGLICLDATSEEPGCIIIDQNNSNWKLSKNGQKLVDITHEQQKTATNG
jgi:hypothetical protein